MKINYSVLAWLIATVLTSGCTHSLYQGELEVLNSNDEPRKAVIYWTKTDVVIGEDKAGPAILMTECSTRRLSFVEKGTGLYFFGAPDRDRLMNQAKPINTPNILCGKIIDKLRFKSIEPGPLEVNIRCTANVDEFSVDTPGASPAYIKAQQEPYTFEITETSDWNMSGEVPFAPPVPTCRE